MSKSTTQIDMLGHRLLDLGFEIETETMRINIVDWPDLLIFITLDDPFTPTNELTRPMGLFSGCALKVIPVAPLWRTLEIDRAKQVKHKIMRRLVDADIAPGPICERWEDVIL